MRKCDNCGKEIPLGKDFVEVRTHGFNLKIADFCKPECFEEYYAEKRYSLQREDQTRFLNVKEQEK